MGRSARRVAEIVSRTVVMKRTLSRRFGGASFFVSPGAALSFWRPRLEDVDTALLGMALELVHPGDVVWDIGANVGLFAFSAAGLAGPNGRVLAVEPDPWLVKLLHRSSGLRNEHLAHVDVLSVAVAEDAGVCRFNIAERGRAANYLDGAGTTQAGGVRDSILIPTIACDSLLRHFAAPSVVKIDVEGTEHRVIAGASRLLHEIRPRILCEVSPNNVSFVTTAFHGAGYVLYDADSLQRERPPVTHAVWNTLALPG